MLGSHRWQKKGSRTFQDLCFSTERHVETKLHTVSLVPSPSDALPSYGSGTKASFPATQNLWVLEVQEWLEGPPLGKWNHWSCRKLFLYGAFSSGRSRKTLVTGYSLSRQPRVNTQDLFSRDPAYCNTHNLL